MGVRIASDTRPVQVTGSSIEGRSRCRLARNELIPGSRYVLKRWVGEGGMGVIYEAEHVDVRRPVAVKILRPEYATNLEVINAFRFEARATSGLDSPFLVKIFDFFELPDGRSALVMELLEGTDMARREDPLLEPARVIGLARQVCKALQMVHDSGLVHRDLKPENIFVCSGEREEVRVLDFGIARLTTQATSAQSGGTPLYTAPEVILGGGQGPVADIYALGCVLYELLTGETAFGREDVDTTLQAHLKERPAPPSERVESLSPVLDAVVMKAIARKPEHRYQSMAELEAALCEAQVEAGLTTDWDDLPLPEQIPASHRERLSARMPDPTPRAAAPASRIRLWAAIALSVALGGGIAYTLTRPDPDATQALSPEERKAQTLDQEARKAGSRAAWVYPSPDDITSRTAYQAVLALEAMGEIGRPVAATLRADFATTLTRLGDDYWDAEGGARFAVAYYEQALIFEPKSIRARERSGMKQASLDSFSDRAATGRFALEELVRVEPLVELAALEDETPPEERITRVKRRRKAKAAAVAMPAAPEPEPEPQPQPEFEAPVEEVVEEAADSGPVERAAPDEAPLRDPAAAQVLVTDAKAAAKSGKDSKAKLLYDRAIAKDSRNVAAYAGLRDLAFDAGDYARAVRHGKRAAQLAPRNATHQLRLGDAYYRTHKYAQAEKAYAAAAKLGDDRATWRLERAREKLGG